MQFIAECSATVQKNGAMFVLLKFTGHLIGEIPKELGQLKQGQAYEITIKEHHGDVAMSITS